MMYYNVNLQKLSYREYWRMTFTPVSFCGMVLRRWLGLLGEKTFGYPRLESIAILQPEQVPSRLLERSTEVVKECVVYPLGFAFHYTCHPFKVPPLSACTAFVSTDGLVLVEVDFMKNQWPETVVTATSVLACQKLICTTNKPGWWNWLDQPPEVEQETLPYDRSYAEEVVERQYQRIGSAGSAPVPIDVPHVDKFIVKLANRFADYHVERGVFVPWRQDLLEALNEARRRGLI